MRASPGLIAIGAALGVHGLIAFGLSRAKVPSLSVAAPPAVSKAPSANTEVQKDAKIPSAPAAPETASTPVFQTRKLAPGHRRLPPEIKRSSPERHAVAPPSRAPVFDVEDAPTTEAPTVTAPPIFDLPAQTVH